MRYEKTPGTTKNRERVVNLFVLLSSVILCFTILEVCARIYLHNFASQESFLRYASLKQLEGRIKKGGQPYYKKSFHRYLGYYLTPDYQQGRNKHNSLGFRGEEIVIPKPADQFRIVCLGGSTTYTSGVEDYRHSYPELLEQEILQRGFANVDVINAGVPGWTSLECLINFQLRLLDLAPDMVIFYEAINDIHTRLVWPAQAYRGDNSGCSIPAVSSIFMPSILEYSSLIRFLLVRTGLMQPHADITKTIDRHASTYYGDNFQRQKILQTYPRGVFEEASAQEMLEVNRPVYFRRNVENIVVTARARNIQAVLATFAYSPLFEREPRVSSPEYIAAYSEMNEVLKTVAAENGAHLFDFASAFPIDKQYYHDGRHVNELGARLMAKLFADFIVDNKLISGDHLRHYTNHRDLN